MAKISNVDITSLLFQEGSAPTTPASTKWRAYFKTTGLFVIDDAGTEYGPLGATPAFVGARVYNNAGISITTSGTSQVLTFNSERYDTDTIHDTGSNTGRLTAPSDGYYLITAHAEFAANATGYRGLIIRLGGSTNLAAQTQPSNGASLVSLVSISTVYFLSATNYVEVLAYQNSGGPLDVNANGNRSPEFSISKL